MMESNYHFYSDIPNNRNHYASPAYQTSLPNIQTQFQDFSQSGTPTLPPLHSRGSTSAQHDGSFDQYSRPHQPPYGATAGHVSAYGSSPVPYGHFPNYSSDSLVGHLQSPQGYGVRHDSHPSNYLPQLQTSAYGLNQGLPPPLPSSSQPYGMVLPSAYDHTPTHVVGSQGRRGILPSDEGRPAAVVANGSPAHKAAAPPAKDSEGKYPCPHCNKTYLHAKHLKRHMLRHTGDRPYSCFLCNDTFSRSDILKRHFQKCSLRRGNPTGATHLSNSQSHLRKQAAKRTSAEMSKITSPHDTRPGGVDGFVHGTGPMTRPSNDNLSSMPSDDSAKGQAFRDRRNLTGPPPLDFNQSSYDSYSQQNTPALPSGMSMASTPHTAGYASHGMSMPQDYRPPLPKIDPMELSGAERQSQSESFDWNSTPAPLKAEGGLGSDELMNGIFGVNHHQPEMLTSSSYENWQIPQQHGWSWSDVSARLLDAFGLSDDDPATPAITSSLAPDNVEHFLQKFANFQAHWPHIHLASFDPMKAYQGLVLCMMSIGAVYSDRTNLQHVRIFQHRVKQFIQTTSDVGQYARDPSLDPSHLKESDEAVEQLVALIILSTVSLWHADPDQRQSTTCDFTSYVYLIRRMGWLEPLPRGSIRYSELHQPDTNPNGVSAAAFDWHAWIRQEARSRTVYTTVLHDIASMLYFNSQPHFTMEEIKLPLPADDAAWESHTSEECAAALGLHGPAAQATANVSGSRRVKQIEMSQAMKVLLHARADFQPRSTNAYSKFLLVHMLHIQLWHAQRHVSQNIDFFNFRDLGAGAAASSPISPKDYLAQSQSPPPPPRSGTSGDGTPADPSPALAHPSFLTLRAALEKWRRSWDLDVAGQYPANNGGGGGTSPPPPPQQQQQRSGFGRDGMPFYWLAMIMLNNPKPTDLFLPSQQRFQQMFALLKQAKRAEYSGGVKGWIDPSYGVDGLTRNMKLLFGPISPGGSPAAFEIGASPPLEGGGRT